MRQNAFRLALGAAVLLAGLSTAGAAQKTVTTKDAAGTGTLSFCAFDAGSFGLAPCQVPISSSGVELFTSGNPGMVGLAFGGSALTLGQKTKGGALPVALPLDPDILNVAATITAADGASTTTTGQNGVSIVTGTPTAGSTYSYVVNGQSEAVFTIGNVFVGTLQFEGSANGGTTWTPRSAHVMGTKYRQTQATGPGVFHINAAGLTNVRVRDIALTSGTPSVQLNTTSGTGSLYVMNPIELADNATGLSASIKAGGSAALTDSALTVQNPNEAAALGTPADAAYTGSNTATQIALLKAMYGQAAPTFPSTATVPAGTLLPRVVLDPGPLVQPRNTYRIPLSAASTNAINWSTTPKTVFHLRFCNVSTSAPAILRLYDVATAPTVGTTSIKASFGTLPGQCYAQDWPEGYLFATGLSASLTAGDGDADTTPVAASQVKYLNVDTN